MEFTDHYGVLSRNNTVQTVLESFRLDIVLRKYHPGEPVREISLAQKYGCSRASVRSAFFVLEKEGLITALKNGTKQVQSLEPEDIRNLYDLRRHIELTSIRQVFESGHKYCSPMLGALGAVAASDGKNARELLVIDTDFHRSIVASSRNKALLQAWENMAGLLYAIFNLNMTDSKAYEMEFIQTFKPRHIELMGHLMNSPEQSLALMEQHIEEAFAISQRAIANRIKEDSHEPNQTNL